MQKVNGSALDVSWGLLAIVTKLNPSEKKERQNPSVYVFIAMVYFCVVVCHAMMGSFMAL